MLNILKKIFGRSDKLVSLGNFANRREFVKAFSQTDVWLLSSPFSDVDMAIFNQEELIAHIAKAAKNLAEKLALNRSLINKTIKIFFLFLALKNS